MIRTVALCTAIAVTLAAFVVVGGDGLVPDAVMVRYPVEFKQLLVADLAYLLKQPGLPEGFFAPLLAARHPLNGIVQILDLFKLNPDQIQFVAHGSGPGLTSFSLVQGAPFRQTFGALQGLKSATGAPGSPYQNWALEDLGGVPAVFTGGVFGPVLIQWAYIPTESALWVGTETAFQPNAPNTDRLRATAQKVVTRIQGRGPYMDEFTIAISMRGGRIAFTRMTDPKKDKPLEVGEQAMGFSIDLVGGKVTGKFEIRFETESQAAAALANIKVGKSGYLAQEIYAAQLTSAKQVGRTVIAQVETDLRGLVGLLTLAMPF